MSPGLNVAAGKPVDKYLPLGSFGNEELHLAVGIFTHSAAILQVASDEQIALLLPTS